MRDDLSRRPKHARSLTLVVPTVLLMTAGMISCSSQPIIREPSPDKAFQEKEQAALISATESDLERARKNSERAQKNSEATAEYHFSLAQAYIAEGSPDRAIEEYKLALMFDSNSALVYARLATEYIKKGMLSDAMATCKEALQRDPKYIDARLMLAGLYSSMKETNEAVREYEIVLNQDPKNEEAAIYLAQGLGEAGLTQTRFQSGRFGFRFPL